MKPDSIQYAVVASCEKLNHLPISFVANSAPVCLTTSKLTEVSQKLPRLQLLLYALLLKKWFIGRNQDK
jgi:hypothetical protein